MPTGPFDSPAEERFLHHITKVLQSGVSYVDHEPVDTLCGPFVIDYVVRVDDRRIGFEVDGRDYHEPEHDEWRDAAILAAEAVDVMIHVRAADLYNYPHDTLLLIARVEPSLFSERGRSILERLAHKGTRDLSFHPHQWSLCAAIWRQE